jgi:NADH dehydrogenase/NADH:ubiquinone oxidoreductase subunit G
MTQAPSDNVTLTIDGKSVTVPKGTNVLEAARTLGMDISAFCYHPGLPVVAQCRQCLVSVEKNPKLQPSCQQVCGEGMVVHTNDGDRT